MEFQRHDKVLCRILNYIPKERSFEVEDVISHTKGWVIFVNHYQDIPPMKEAYNNHKTLPLYFDKYEGGIPLFAYRIYNDNIKRESASNNQVVNSDVLSVSMCFSNSNSDYNSQLFEALYNTLGDAIDSEEKYNLAKQLLAVNRNLKIKKGLTKDLFKISNSTYQTRFWNEGLLPFCSNIGIRKAWNNADENERHIILQRLGIIVSVQEQCSLESYFEGIEDVVLRNIISAKSSIYACMAWFTNFNIFKALKQQLSEGLDIILITNNDLINNGGYCLNLNELIEAGLKLHLAEYPELIHHKFCVIDKQIVMTGSYNWTFFSENINRENMVLIKDNEQIVTAFYDEFCLLKDKYDEVSSMPETVPEKPEYDRSSFKQYISEELVLRSKKRIGNIKDNIIKAKGLSPMYSTVLKAISDFNVVEDNRSLTVEQIEQTANTAAISERLEHINNLNQRKQNLVEQRENLEIERQQLLQQQEEVAVQAQQIQDNTEVSETERQELQETIRVQEQELVQRQEQIETTITQVEQESSTIEKTVVQTQTEIATIENTSLIETKGGRGSLKINLKWGTYDDLDLHVVDPDGVEIYYSSKENICQGVLGKLDIDANAGSSLTKTPQENIFWEEGKNAPLGRYKVSVVLFKKRDTLDRIPFTVTIYPEKGVSKVFTDVVQYDKDSKSIIEFDYTENGISYIE